MLFPDVPTIHAAPVPGASATLAGLDRYVGKSVADFCQFHYGAVGDDQSHCAHVVSHVMGFRFGATCESLLAWPQVKKNNKIPELKGAMGFTVRVNDVYNNLPSTGDWTDDVAGPCLLFATLPTNFTDATRATMLTQSKKHVGILSGGKVYNYGNTKDAVVADTPTEFRTKFKKNYGSNVVFRYGDFPAAPG